MTQRTVVADLDGSGFVWLDVEAPSPEEIADLRLIYTPRSARGSTKERTSA